MVWGSYCFIIGSGGSVQSHFLELAGAVLGEALQEGLFPQPVGVAEDFPFRDVLLFDGLAGEVAGHEGLDFRQGVEPGDDAGAGHAVMDGAGDLIAEFTGQAPDFSGMRTNF